MRLVFFGSPPFAEPSFRQLLEADLDIVGLVTAAPRRSGRGRGQAENALARLAAARNLAILQPERPAEHSFLAELSALRPDLGVVVSYGQILTEAALAVPRFGCVNLHGSLLPRWRGASPVQAALLAGDSETGVCLQRMVLALDAGPVLTQASVVIEQGEDAPTLSARLAQLGATLLCNALAEWGDSGPPPGLPQKESRATQCRRVKRQDALLDWGHAATELERQIRAMAGWPVAEVRLPSGESLKIHRARAGATHSTASAEPGEILVSKEAEGEESALAIACGQGILLLEQVQRPGKSVLDAASFLRGHTLVPGDRFANGTLEP